jgi:hypothetical protein
VTSIEPVLIPNGGSVRVTKALFCRMALWVFACGQRAGRLRDDSDREAR